MIMKEGKKERKKEGKKEGKKEVKKEGKKYVKKEQYIRIIHNRNRKI